jgi:hypothetical protein
VAAAFIEHHAEAGHPDFKRFRSRLPADLPGVLAPSLEALRVQVVENIAFDDSALINVVEGHMQATGNGASVIAEASQAPFDDRHLLGHVSRVWPPSATKQLSVFAVLRNELLNEHTDNYEICQSVFPGLFPLGVPKTQHGYFPKHAWKTMLDSCQSGFERSVAFLGCSGDAKMRRERSLASSLTVKSSKHFPAFGALVGDSALLEKMTVAVRNPQGETASGRNGVREKRRLKNSENARGALQRAVAVHENARGMLQRTVTAHKNARGALERAVAVPEN